VAIVVSALEITIMNDDINDDCELLL